MMFLEKMEEADVKQLNPLVLAYVGDAVMTLYVRCRQARTSDAKANALHVGAAKLINATNQARFLELVHERLTETESEIFRRARNSKQHTTAKNAKVEDYKKASGLEGVLGYLYLTGDFERINDLLEGFM
ncbi:MAG: ribonuclease III domain-containing protein [Clostridia bacterium]|nr:ribonuclease III domain-containing protein [Clostridia bacterium]